MTTAELIRTVRGDFRRCFAPLAAFEVLFKLLGAFVLAPGMAALLYHLVRRTGTTALTNEDILGFLLSPWGVLYVFLLGLKLLGLTMLERGGIIALAALRQTGHWHGFRAALITFGTRFFRLVRLALLILLIAAVGLAPFAGLAALTYFLLLGNQDINFYLAEQPPRFILACGIGVLLLLLAAIATAYFFVRWVFALPILVLEGHWSVQALRESARRVHGHFWPIARVLLGWEIIALVAQFLVLGAFRLLAGWIVSGLDHQPRSAIYAIALLLVLQGVLVAAVSMIGNVVHCLLVLRLYVARGVEMGVVDPAHWAETLDQTPSNPRRALGRLEGGAAVLAIGAGVFALATTLPFDLGGKVQGTAHRGASRVAPENTLAAIHAAHEAGADWVEIDVQLTRDGEVVLLHDGDLKRMTGDPRKLSQVTLKELKTLPLAGTWGKKFPDERIPTLRDVIALAREDGIKLNIELKFEGRDRTLAKKVAELLREEEFEDQCFVASLTFDGVIACREHNRKLRAAAIVTVAAGDITKLDVDILSINAKLATPALIRKAHARGKEVHVWTVNDRKAMRRLCERGVDNIITDDPALFVEVRDERDEQPYIERLLMACKSLLD